MFLNIKIYLSLLLVIGSISFLSAQQEQHFNQFMNNKLAYNIGYSGTDTKGKLNLVHRSQWVSVDGAPVSQMLNYNQAFMNERVGAGLHLRRQSIGVSTQWTLDLAYAYRLKIKKSTLSLGLGFSMRYFGKNYGDDRLHATESRFFDNSIPEGYQDKTIGNVNMGIYFESKSFYLGLSVPRILDKDIRLSESQSDNVLEVRHYYLMTGYQFKLVDNLALEPNILIKYVESLPLDINWNLNLRVQEKFLFGVNYHSGWRIGQASGNALGVLFGVDINEQINMNLAYDYELSTIRAFTMGSLEFGLGFTFGSAKEEEIIKLDLY